MTVLQAADLRFGYAGDTLFEGVTFSLEIGDRAALVAPNGSGKTTLLRLLAGELEPDVGSVVLRRDATLAVYRQSHEIVSTGDVLGAFLSGFREVVELREELHQAQENAASGSREALDRLARVTDRYHLARGDELEYRVAASRIATSRGLSSRCPAASAGGCVWAWCSRSSPMCCSSTNPQTTSTSTRSDGSKGGFGTTAAPSSS
jgi:ATPase subunit of ABC transporter with duplicated ATPase domains